jgi:pyridoxamine 5'-phosphate oxidase
MVLRKADRATGVFRFHSDIRSTKIAAIKRQNVISIVGYDPGAKIQLRASGTAMIVSNGSLVDAAWSATSLSGRRSYLTIMPPGTPSNAATSGLHPSFEGTTPTHAESEEGRQNFSLILATLDRLEWLHLAASGHRRAAFTRSGNDWAGTWLVP